SNPPFGKKWEKDKAAIEREHKEKGYAGRFGPGLPRVSDGSMLFLLHLVSKLERPENGGGRAAIVLSGSPLFNGGAGSGESEIRRWLLEQDRVDAIVALPTELFFRTGIGTYLWILSNKKPEQRQNKVQLIDATEYYRTMRKNEGNKRREIGPEQIRAIAERYAAFEDGKHSQCLDYRTFGFRRIKVLRPLRAKLRISEAAIAALDDGGKGKTAWNKLGDEQKTAWRRLLAEHTGELHPLDWLPGFVKQATRADPALGK